ncbi:(p)ppGpp synthetase, partial [Candidatus Marinamargulisbacteria bacterium SCGC AG-343-D04]
MTTIDALVKQLMANVKSYLPDSDVDLIKKAYDFSAKSHEGQFRRSKKPYITHPLEVAIILSEWERAVETIVAGILHDVVEDTGVTKDQLVELFGLTIADFVEGVTKLNKLEFSSREEAQVENYRRMFLAMAEDYKIIIIKLADRLHNLRTLQFMPPKKQKAIARETLDIYAPLAHRLGMGSIKWEFEDLSFRYLYPEKFQELKDQIEMTRKEREAYVNERVKDMNGLFKKAKLQVDISGRPKHLYSIFKKLDKKKSSINEIYDLLGFRLIADTVEDCYHALGVIHSKYKPVSERFK